MDFAKQCKGTDADKLKISDSEIFFSSIKYDGVYIQIQKEGDKVSFFTSGGKEFSCVYAAEFLKLDFDFKIETEYICDGGKLRTRAKADNEIKKAVKDSNFQLTGMFMIHDSLDIKNEFVARYAYLMSNIKGFNAFFDIAFSDEVTFKEAKQNLKYIVADGWEGLFLKKATHMQVPGKRSKDSIKLKPKYTADLVVVDVDGLWVSLQGDDVLCARVQVNAAVADDLSEGDIIEIEYEQIIKTYNQAIFKRVRYDKMGE